MLQNLTVTPIRQKEGSRPFYQQTTAFFLMSEILIKDAQ